MKRSQKSENIHVKGRKNSMQKAPNHAFWDGMDDVSSMTFERNESHLAGGLKDISFLLPPIQIGDDPNLTWAFFLFLKMG